MSSRDVNKVIITGRLGRDIELRVTATGVSVATFSVASSRNQKVGDEWKEQTEWFRVVAWNKLADTCGQLLVKGTHVYVEGRGQTREWQDNDGNKRTSFEVIATEVTVLGGGAPRGTARDDIDSAFDNAGLPAAAPAPVPTPRTAAYSELADIPF